MSNHPSSAQAWTILWFPFFFAAAFSLMFLSAFSATKPHEVKIAVVGSTEQVDAVRLALERFESGGFIVTSTSTAGGARTLITANSAAAAYVLTPSDGAELLVSSAASSTRADYLTSVASTTIDPAVGVESSIVLEVVPRSAGDVTGVGLFFYALPLLLVGLITSIVLLQLPGWSRSKRLVMIATTGVFASIFSFALAVSSNILPNNPWLVAIAVALTQTIGWLTSGIAVLTKRFFMPISMTFVLILGVPSAGATVNGDMLPSFVAALNSVLPLAQLVDATRSVGYFEGAGALQPLLILLGWAVVGAALFAFAVPPGTERSTPLDRPSGSPATLQLLRLRDDPKAAIGSTPSSRS